MNVEIAPNPSQSSSWKTPDARRALILFAIGALVGLGIAGYALFTSKGTTVNTVPPEDMALVNGLPILRSDFIAQTEVVAGKPYKDTSRAERLKTLNDMIAEEVLVQRGVELGLSQTDPDVRSAMVNGVGLLVDADIVAQQPSQEVLMAYYEKNKEKYSTMGVMQLQDIVLPADTGMTPAMALATAQKAVAALRAGKPVATVMAAYGFKDTNLVDKSENLDFAVKLKLGEPLFTEITKLSENQISEPITRPEGVHIIIMTKRIPAVKADFAKVADQVWQNYKEEARKKVEQDNLNFLLHQAEIQVTPEYKGEAYKGR